MKKTKRDIVADTIFLIALVACVTILMVDIHIGRNPAKASSEPSGPSITDNATETIAEPAETEPLVIEVVEPSETDPPLTLYDVPLDKDLQLHIINQAEAHGIDPAIIMAMAFHESTYNADAVGDGGNSYGLLQVQPKWHYERMLELGCTDLLDPYQNITVAVDYICELMNRYGDIEKALTAYNKGHYAGTITSYARSVMETAEELRGEIIE